MSPMKAKFTFLLLGLGLILMAACTKYPPASDRLLEDLAIFTQYDTKAEFDTYKTYSVSPTIMKVTSIDTTALADNVAAPILAQIKQNMNARGFQEIANPGVTNLPDLGIQVVYYQNTYVYAYYDYYWGYPYYDWGWYYPYYPVYYSSYTAGTASIELVDLKNVDPQDPKLYLRWNAYIRGLVTGDHTTGEITGAIDQAFIQTPKLKTTAK